MSNFSSDFSSPPSSCLNCLLSWLVYRTRPLALSHSFFTTTLAHFSKHFSSSYTSSQPARSCNSPTTFNPCVKKVVKWLLLLKQVALTLYLCVVKVFWSGLKERSSCMYFLSIKKQFYFSCSGHTTQYSIVNRKKCKTFFIFFISIDIILCV